MRKRKYNKRRTRKRGPGKPNIRKNKVYFEGRRSYLRKNKVYFGTGIYKKGTVYLEQFLQQHYF